MPIAVVGSQRRSICSCCISLGLTDLTLYDGLMGEWAKDPALPIEKG